MQNQKYVEKIKSKIYDLMEDIPILINLLIRLEKVNYDTFDFYKLDRIDHILANANMFLFELKGRLISLCSDLAPTEKQIELGKEINEILIKKEKSPMFCDHANECPNICPCKNDCYCKSNSCRKE